MINLNTNNNLNAILTLTLLILTLIYIILNATLYIGTCNYKTIPLTAACWIFVTFLVTECPNLGVPPMLVALTLGRGVTLVDVGKEVLRIGLLTCFPYDIHQNNNSILLILLICHAYNEIITYTLYNSLALHSYVVYIINR